jgi:hypothetical protein
MWPVLGAGPGQAHDRVTPVAGSHIEPETAARIADVLPDQRCDRAQIPWRQPPGPVRPALLQEMPSPAAFTGQVVAVALP